MLALCAYLLAELRFMMAYVASEARKDAEAILEMALGRPGSRARFLPHKDNLIPTDPSGQTSSGLLAGKINVTPEGQVLLKPHFELLPQDYLSTL